MRRYLSYVEAVVADDDAVVDAAVRSYGGASRPRAAVLTDVRPSPHGEHARK